MDIQFIIFYDIIFRFYDCVRKWEWTFNACSEGLGRDVTPKKEYKTGFNTFESKQTVITSDIVWNS
jgi:hypothetical protein